MSIVIIFVFCLLSSLLILSIFVDWTSCVIDNASSQNGYYTERNSQGSRYYEKITSNYQYFPDFFRLFEIKYLHTKTAISYVSGATQWIIVEYNNKNYIPIYYSSNSTSEDLPPINSWVAIENKEKSPLTCRCRGQLSAVSSREESNIIVLWHHPVSTIIMGGLTYIAYYIWANRIDHDTLTFSYTAVVDGKEYWRMFTASVAHFDILHLGFNVMGMFTLKDMETTYNSLKFGRADQARQPSVGYSCVLFAWMVAQSVRMSEFCPLGGLLPNFCFYTYSIPLGFVNFPINIGPILLLIITKFIIPRSSFTGHLSGILVGLPLAWDLLDVVTPPLFLAVIVPTLLAFRNLYVWKFSGYNEFFVVVTDLTSQDNAKIYRWLHKTMIGAAVASTLLIFIDPWFQTLPRAVFVALCYAIYRTRHCMFISENRSAHEECMELILISLGYIAAIAAFDLWSFVAVLVSFTLLTVNLSLPYYLVGITAYFLSLLLEVAVISLTIASLQENPTAVSKLLPLRLDWASLYKDLQKLRLVRGSSSGLPPGRAFTGRSNRVMPVPSSVQVVDGTVVSRNPLHVGMDMRNVGSISQSDETVLHEDSISTHFQVLQPSAPPYSVFAAMRSTVSAAGHGEIEYTTLPTVDDTELHEAKKTKSNGAGAISGNQARNSSSSHPTGRPRNDSEVVSV